MDSFKFHLEEGLRLHHRMKSYVEDSVALLATMLPRLVCPFERTLVRRMELKSDPIKNRRLKQLLGPVFYPLLGKFNGYFVLDLVKSNDRHALRLFLERSQYNARRRSSHIRHVRRRELHHNNASNLNIPCLHLGNCSQNGDWSGFRNLQYEGQKLEGGLTWDFVSPLPHRGKLDFDFVDLSSRPGLDHRRPMTDSQIFAMVKGVLGVWEEALSLAPLSSSSTSGNTGPAGPGQLMRSTSKRLSSVSAHSLPSNITTSSTTANSHPSLLPAWESRVRQKWQRMGALPWETLSCQGLKRLSELGAWEEARAEAVARYLDKLSEETALKGRSKEWNGSFEYEQYGQDKPPVLSLPEQPSNAEGDESKILDPIDNFDDEVMIPFSSQGLPQPPSNPIRSQSTASTVSTSSYGEGEDEEENRRRSPSKDDNAGEDVNSLQKSWKKGKGLTLNGDDSMKLESDSEDEEHDNLTGEDGNGSNDDGGMSPSSPSSSSQSPSVRLSHMSEMHQRNNRLKRTSVIAFLSANRSNSIRRMRGDSFAGNNAHGSSSNNNSNANTNGGANPIQSNKFRLEFILKDESAGTALKCASWLDYFTGHLEHRSLLCRHLIPLLEAFQVGKRRKTKYGSYRVELLVRLWSQILDPGNAMVIWECLTAQEVAALCFRLGWLTWFNPWRPEGSYVLNLSSWEQRKVRIRCYCSFDLSISLS